jgi:hypothetical protein
MIARVFSPVKNALCALLLSACTEQPDLPKTARAPDGGDASLAFGLDAQAGADVSDAALVQHDALQAEDADTLDGATLDAADADGGLALPHAEFDAGVTDPTRTSLVSPAHWQLLDAGEDPFQDRPALIDCLSGAVVAEDLGGEYVLGIETGFCNYMTALQATQRAVAVGEVIKVRLWHFELSAPDPAEAHAVLQIDGLRILDERIPIPAPGGLTVRMLRVERAIAAGAPVYFHLHNHGANSWALVEVSAGAD